MRNIKLLNIYLIIILFFIPTALNVIAVEVIPYRIFENYIPRGDDFPGDVPPRSERSDINSIVLEAMPQYDSQRRILVSTGVWIQRGKEVLLRIKNCPEENKWNGECRIRLQISVGLHDYIKNVPEEERLRPLEISFKYQFDHLNRMSLLPPASGLLYFVSAVDAEIEISGDVYNAPWFRLGDDVRHWQDIVRHYPAPWAELQGKLSVLTLPSGMIRDVDDPTKIIEAYDYMVQSTYTFLGYRENDKDQRHIPPKQQRFLIDLQGSSGFMSHSGYPVVMISPDPHVDIDTDIAWKRRIVYHEMVHNLFDVRVFGIEYAVESYTDFITHLISGHNFPNYGARVADIHHTPALKDRYFFQMRIPGISQVIPYDIWSAKEDWDSGIHSFYSKFLFFYNVLDYVKKEDFTTLHRYYRELGEKQLPEDIQGRRDLFFKTLCRISGKDLSPLFQSWYFPVSALAYSEVGAQSYERPWTLFHDGL